MSVNLSVSNDKHSNCNHIIKKMLKLGINCRVMESVSVVENNIEKGCVITVDPEYYDKNKLRNFWCKLKGNDYTCANLTIPGTFDGCIYNYINCDYCPGSCVRGNLPSQRSLR